MCIEEYEEHREDPNPEAEIKTPVIRYQISFY